MGLKEDLFFKKVNTRSYYKNQAWSVDSPVSLLLFSPLSFFSRIRVGMVIALMKLIPNGRFLEKYSAEDFLKKTMGNNAWNILWKPLFVGKFGKYSSEINMAWFWARIATRSQKLGYYRGGFLKLAEDMTEALENKGVNFHFGKSVKKIVKHDGKIKIVVGKNNQLIFDKVLATIPSTVLSKVMKIEKNSFSGLSARTLLLELDKPFFKDETYWLSIHQDDWPFLAAVEHTNLADKNNYGKKHLLYVGKYLDKKDKFYKLSKEELIKIYKPFLDKLSPGFSKNILRSWVFDADFAQPLVFKNHSKNLPNIKTPIKGVFWISMQHVYPWDRGINYAIRFGRSSINYLKE